MTNDSIKDLPFSILNLSCERPVAIFEGKCYRDVDQLTKSLHTLWVDALTVFAPSGLQWSGDHAAHRYYLIPLFSPGAGHCSDNFTNYLTQLTWIAILEPVISLVCTLLNSDFYRTLKRLLASSPRMFSFRISSGVASAVKSCGALARVVYFRVAPYCFTYDLKPVFLQVSTSVECQILLSLHWIVLMVQVCVWAIFGFVSYPLSVYFDIYACMAHTLRFTSTAETETAHRHLDAKLGVDNEDEHYIVYAVDWVRWLSGWRLAHIRVQTYTTRPLVFVDRVFNFDTGNTRISGLGRFFHTYHQIAIRYRNEGTFKSIL